MMLQCSLMYYIKARLTLPKKDYLVYTWVGFYLLLGYNFLAVDIFSGRGGGFKAAPAAGGVSAPSRTTEART